MGDIVYNGCAKQPVRHTSDGREIVLENSTIGVFGSVFSHDMANGFPLTTLRKMPFKSTCIELEGFIGGITSKQWYKDRGCNYWNYWANPQAIKEYRALNKDCTLSDKELAEKLDDLGPCVYGANWRRFHDPHSPNTTIDQLSKLVENLKKNPYDRRMIVTSWNPMGLDHTALPACHTQFTVCVYGNKLNLGWEQRSCDWLINQTICTYGILMLLLCEESGLSPGILQGRFIDNHIYTNQIDAALSLLEREERDLPKVIIKRKSDGSFSIFDWTHKDIELVGYNPHPPVKIGAITV